MFDVAIIILNYNSSAYTIRCVESILDHTGPSISHQIILVDNHSTLADYEQLKFLIKKHPQLSLIRNHINDGFAGGNMLGAKAANARYLFFLNNDTELKNDCISILTQFMDNDQQVGVCTAQMYDSAGRFHFSFTYHPTAATYWLGVPLLKLLRIGQFPSKKIHYQIPQRVDVVTGSAMFIRANAFWQIGGFDTNYFLYCEEEDICKRMYEAGYTVYLVPEAKFVHHIGKSSTPGLHLMKENIISKLYYHRKFSGSVSYRLVCLFLILKHLRKSFKSSNHLKLAWFTLLGAPISSSLRHRQATHEA